MEIVLVRKNIHKSIALMNNINSANSNIRIFKIITTIEECLEIISNHSINGIIIDYSIFKEMNIVDFSKLQNLIDFTIIISEKLTLSKHINCIFSKEEQIIENLCKINKTSNENNIKFFILNELKYLGYNSSYNGTKYLIECIYFIYKNYSRYNDNSFAEVYSIISKKYNKSVNTLKCNISHATSIMFSENEEEKIKSYLGIYTLPKTGYRIIIQTILNKLNTNF